MPVIYSIGDLIKPAEIVVDDTAGGQDVVVVDIRFGTIVLEDGHEAFFVTDIQQAQRFHSTDSVREFNAPISRDYSSEHLFAIPHIVTLLQRNNYRPMFPDVTSEAEMTRVRLSLSTSLNSACIRERDKFAAQTLDPARQPRLRLMKSWYELEARCHDLTEREVVHTTTNPIKVHQNTLEKVEYTPYSCSIHLWLRATETNELWWIRMNEWGKFSTENLSFVGSDHPVSGRMWLAEFSKHGKKWYY